MGCGSSIARRSDSEPTSSAGPASARSPAAAAAAAPPSAGAAEAAAAASSSPAQFPQPAPVPRSAPASTAPAAGVTPSRPQSRPPSKPGSARKATADGAASTASSTVASGAEPPLELQPSQSGAQGRARDLTSLLAQRLQEQRELEQREIKRQRSLPRQAQSRLSLRSVSSHGLTASGSCRLGAPAAGSGSGGLGAEVAALLGDGDRFQELLQSLMASAQTQVLLPSDVNTEDAAALQAVTGCSMDQAVRLLECLTVVRAAADVLGPTPTGAAAESAATPDRPPSDSGQGSDPAAEDAGGAPQRDLGQRGAAEEAEGAAAAGAAAGPPPSPGPQQLTRQLGALAGLLNDVPGLRTAALARDAADPLLRILLRHSERAAAANAALALGALAAGPPPHKTALIAAGVVDGLLQAARGRTAAAEAAAGDAPVVAGNSLSALGNLATGHTAGAAAVAAAPGGVDTLIGLLAAGNPPNIRTNAAGVLVQLTGAHESYRAAVAAAGGLAALAAGILRGPDAPACNAATALFNLATLRPPSLRPAMAQLEGQFSIVSQLLLCMAGRNASGAADESVAAASATRINASAVLLELCKDPAAAPLLADSELAVPAALAALVAGRIPPPPPAVATAAEAYDVLSAGVALLYPIPPGVRGSSLLCLMALARLGPLMQLELGRCGALAALLELLEPGQDPAMQVNAANAICSLAAANSDIHSALVAARCVPVLAGLLEQGGDAARANVAAVLVTMMREPAARSQMQECGALTSIVRLTAALLDGRRSTTGFSSPGPSGPSGPDGVLCNCAGALAEAARHPDLRRSLAQVEFGECLGTLLRCLREGPEPAQANAAAALCHMCRDQSAAVQLGRMRGVELLKEAIVPRLDDGGAGGFSLATSWSRPSSRLRHNASRALVRLQDQLTAANEEAQALALARAAFRASAASAAAAAADNVRPLSAAKTDVEEVDGEPRGVEGDEAGGGGSGGARSRRSDPPRPAWNTTEGDAAAADAEAAGAAAPPPNAGASRLTLEAVSYEEDDLDSLSTVITPPLPLAAF